MRRSQTAVSPTWDVLFNEPCPSNTWSKPSCVPAMITFRDARITLMPGAKPAKPISTMAPFAIVHWFRPLVRHGGLLFLDLLRSVYVDYERGVEHRRVDLVAP